jgi:hypothetical protein
MGAEGEQIHVHRAIVIRNADRRPEGGVLVEFGIRNAERNELGVRNSESGMPGADLGRIEGAFWTTAGS